MIEQSQDKFEARLNKQWALVRKGTVTTIEAFGDLESWMVDIGGHKLFLNPFFKVWFYYNPLNRSWESTGYRAGEFRFVVSGEILGMKKLPPKEENTAALESAEISSSKEQMEREGKTWYDSWGWVTPQVLKQLEKQAAIYKEEYAKETEELIRKLSTEEPFPSAEGSLCSKCGRRNPAGAIYCTSCGAEVESQISSSPDSAVCAKCGSAHPMWAKFCNKCGNKFEALAASKPEGNKCSKCGNINSVEAKFCNKCGQKTEARPITRACPVCSDPVVEGETFCTQCGTKLEAEVKARFCPKCGDPITENEKFCNKCGRKLS